MVEQKITAIMIVEIAGRPSKHVKETLDKHVSQIKNIKEVELINKTLSEPKLLDKEKDIYTCFAEVEVEANGLKKLTDLMFDFMPSSIEILEPSELRFDIQEATSFLNDLTGRLHKYDEIAKVAQLQTQKMQAQIEQANKKTPKEKSKESKNKKSKKS